MTKLTMSDGVPHTFEVTAKDLLGVLRGLTDEKGLALKFVTATDERDGKGGYRIWYVFGAPGAEQFVVPYLHLTETTDFPSITASFHSAWNDERKIKSMFGLTPVGHPDERMIVLHDENWPADQFPLRKDFAWDTRPAIAHGTYPFKRVEGEGIYEIPVGPIHAGIIEPGHFRFSVAGEEIMQLEPRLGFVHKGIEKLFETLPMEKKVRLSESVSGDSSFSHSLAFCEAIEELGGVSVSRRARYVRVIFAELERLANHLGDIGAIMVDTGFNFGGSQGARLREQVMQIHERLTGSRFLRGVNTIGGVTADFTTKTKRELAHDLERINADFLSVIDIAENTTSLLARLKGAGVLSREVAEDLGMMGVAGKAVGIARDARVDAPYAAYDECSIGEIVTEPDGDVYSRFRVRVKEALASIRIIQNAVQTLPDETSAIPTKIELQPNACVVRVVEGWRGEIVYFVTTDNRGNVSRVAVRDPSWINWNALPYAGYGNMVPDFPLINKSFNMSYSGNDL